MGDREGVKEWTDEIDHGPIGHIPNDFLIPRLRQVKTRCCSINVIGSQGIYQGFDGPKSALMQNQISRKDVDCKLGISFSWRTECRNTNDS
jgi:hypothetical protein